MRFAAVPQRQQHHLEIEPFARFRGGREAGHHAGGFLDHSVDEVGDLSGRVRGPKAMKGEPPQLAAEEGTDARASVSARMWRIGPGSISPRSGVARSPRKESQ